MKGRFEKQALYMLGECYTLKELKEMGLSDRAVKVISPVMINEARKEFPKRRRFFTGEKTEDTWTRLSNEREEWFEEWFSNE